MHFLGDILGKRVCPFLKIIGSGVALDGYYGVFFGTECTSTIHKYILCYYPACLVLNTMSL